MNTEEAVRTLKEKVIGAVVGESTLCGQTTVEVRIERLKEVLVFLKQTLKPGYEVLMDLTAVDYIHPVKRTKIVYLLHNPTNYTRLIVTIYIDREEPIPSVIDLWEGADWYERELYDLFGVHFIGHPDMQRILMPDDWKGHPLRRDYALTEEPVEFKHGVKPKVPSEIIPYVKNFVRS
ncbi:MAG: NADH-quinone oxidoreductase subunit C [Parachlamydiaceae bacterium]